MKQNWVTRLAVLLTALVAFSPVLLAGGAKKHLKVVTLRDLDAFDARVDALLEAGYQLPRPLPHPGGGDGPGITVLTSDTLGETTYDFAWNQIPDNQVAVAPGGAFDGIHMTYMKRVPTGTSNRFATYSYYSRLIGDFLGEFVPSANIGSGWPRVVDGPGHAGMYIFHGPGPGASFESTLMTDDGEGFLTFGTSTVVDPVSSWPGIDINGNTVVVTISDDISLVPARTHVSTDAGATWTEIGFPPLIIPGTTDFGTAETMPALNPAAPTHIGMANSEADAAGSVGGIVWNVSDDLSAGTNWTNTLVYQFGSLLPDNSFYDPGAGSTTHQLAGVFSSDGTGHVVFNGAGQQLDANGDTLYPIFPVVYWNSADQQLIEVSDPAVARNPVLADSINAYWPGRGLGLAFQHIATGPNGAVLVAWQGPELENPSQLRFLFGNLGPNLVKVYATDIYAALSLDNGQSWSSAFKLAGEDSQMDLYPQIALEDRPDGLHAHVLYLYDSNPGESISGESDASLCAWIYNEVLLPTTGIGDGDGVPAAGFQLRQNYPNPFNPTTTISFTLKQAAVVSLEVFNLLGEKVATLLNEQQPAGNHTLSFDASALTSGVYFYTLRAGDFKQTRKMILMK